MINPTPYWKIQILPHMKILLFLNFIEVTKYHNDTNQQLFCWFAIDDTPGFYPDNAPVYLTNSGTGFIEEDILNLNKMITDLLLKSRSQLKQPHYIRQLSNITSIY